MQSLNNFNAVVFPQDIRYCTTCHNQTHANLTQAANYNTVPTAEACGACHDNVNFATGANHSSNIVADDTQCVTCHGPSSTLDNGQLQVITAHQILERVFQSTLAYNVRQESHQRGAWPGGDRSSSSRSRIPAAATRPTTCLPPTPPHWFGYQTFDGGFSDRGDDTGMRERGFAPEARHRLADTSDYTNWAATRHRRRP